MPELCVSSDGVAGEQREVEGPWDNDHGLATGGMKPEPHAKVAKGVAFVSGGTIRLVIACSRLIFQERVGFPMRCLLIRGSRSTPSGAHPL